MKKNAKRMTLSRETLAELGSEALETAAGASGRPICCVASGSCPPPPSAGDTTC
ncbi:MAG TPA: hypothetical protein VIJ61_15080 [Thermoanaerobaculia bacterium]